MNTKKELIIAFIVGLLMIGICCFFIFGKNINRLDTSNLKVYKLLLKDGVDENDETIDEVDKYYYVQCNVAPQDKELILKQFYKIIKFKMNQTKSGANLRGNYKVVNNDQYIAFDNNTDKEVYSSETNRVHTYDNPIYDTIINSCEN